MKKKLHKHKYLKINTIHSPPITTLTGESYNKEGRTRQRELLLSGISPLPLELATTNDAPYRFATTLSLPENKSTSKAEPGLALPELLVAAKLRLYFGADSLRERRERAFGVMS